MKKQTAVEWLKKELENYGSNSHLSLDWTTFDELVDQAKEIEKQQHQQTAIYFYPSALKRINFEQYYKETYGK
jgi:hypothetical protein